jgi:hypothetical protein
LFHASIPCLSRESWDSSAIGHAFIMTGHPEFANCAQAASPSMSVATA